MKTNASNLKGFRNIRINGVRSGSIIWDESTGLIVGTYLQKQSVPDEVEVVWMDGRDVEAYPAVIDGHVHDRFDEPDKEDRQHLEAACVAGGVGTIMTMPNNRRPFTHPDQLEARINYWSGSPLTVCCHIGVSRDNLAVIADLAGLNNKWLGQVKEYDASSTNPSTLIDDEPTQIKAAEAIGQSGRIKLVHAEYEPWLKRNRQQIERERRLLLDDHCIIRSLDAEVEGIRRAIQICRDTGVPTHFCHVSTKGGLELIADAKAEGLPVTCETCPHYWRLNSAHFGKLRGRAKMNPALRSEFEMLWVEELIATGVVDIIATDHAPHEPWKKAEIGYDECPSGVPGVQTMCLMVYELKTRGRISAQRFVDLTSRNAARIFGFNKGELSAGKDADIMLINQNRATLFGDAMMRSKCGWTPFDGALVNGSIEAVVLGGKVVKRGQSS